MRIKTIGDKTDNRQYLIHNMGADLLKKYPKNVIYISWLAWLTEKSFRVIEEGRPDDEPSEIRGSSDLERPRSRHVRQMLKDIKRRGVPVFRPLGFLRKRDDNALHNKVCLAR